MMTNSKMQAKLNEILNDARKAVEAREIAQGRMDAYAELEKDIAKKLKEAQKELFEAQNLFARALENEKFALELVGPALLGVLDSKLYTAWEDRAV